jgi:hypothetical protein
MVTVSSPDPSKSILKMSLGKAFFPMARCPTPTFFQVVSAERRGQSDALVLTK